MASGRIQKYEGQARIAETPDYVVAAGGDIAAALQALGGGVAGRLKQMADQAKKREETKAGTPVGEEGANQFIAQRNAENQARATAANVPPELDVHIVGAANKYGVSADALRMIAGIESGGNVSAQNPNSSAGGPFQFVDGTAKDYGLVDRFDPAQASDAAARLLRDNAAALRTALGREPTAPELYLAHQQGGQGAINLLTNPGARAVDIVGEQAVTLNGGKADMTAADFAGIWLAKAGAGSPPTSGPGGLPAITTSGPTTTPLQLRNDGTIGGDAFDAAAIQAYGWRVMTQLSAELGQAAIDHQADPTGYSQAVAQIEQRYLQEAPFDEPELRETFARTFIQKTTVDRMNVSAQYEIKMRQEQVSTANAGLDAVNLELERHAYSLGAYGQGDALLQSELTRAFNQVDYMVQAGVLTKDEGIARRAGLTETMFRGQVEGTFDQLGSPAEKQDFARQILDDYTAGEGPFGILSLDEVQNLSGELSRRATADANTLTLEQQAEKARVEALLIDDVASLQSTGQPLDLAANGIKAAEVQAVIGDEAFAKWTAARNAATSEWESTARMRVMSETDIQAYLAGIAPKPGQPGFVGQQETFDRAVQVSNQILKDRKDDPAGYVYSAYPQIQAAWEKATTSQSPEAWRQAIAQTVNVQATLGVAVPQPLPSPMAQFVVENFSNVELPEGDRIKALTDIVFATSDVGQQQLIFEQLVKSGVDGSVSGALGAWERGDLEGGRRLFQASMINPEGLPGKVPETTAAINEAIQRQIMAPGAIGDVYYGISDGTAESFVTAERDAKLLQRAVQARLLRGEGLSDAVNGAAMDLFGDLVPVRGGWEVNAEILLPRNEDPAPYLAGLAELQPRIRAALEGAMALPSLSPPDSSAALEQGNIDLSARPIVQNDDGSISTVRSMSFEEDGVEILVPMVSPDGKMLTDAEALQLYHDTGQHLGKFPTADAATAYANALHEQQQAQYDRSTGALAIFSGATSNYVESVLSEGSFRNVRDGFVYIDPFTGAAVAGPDGQPLIFSEADVVAAGQAAALKRRPLSQPAPGMGAPLAWPSVDAATGVYP